MDLLVDFTIILIILKFIILNYVSLICFYNISSGIIKRIFKNLRSIISDNNDLTICLSRLDYYIRTLNTIVTLEIITEKF